jgi:ATP-dependent RNA helicase SUPV3L1/SUV3
MYLDLLTNHQITNQYLLQYTQGLTQDLEDFKTEFESNEHNFRAESEIKQLLVFFDCLLNLLQSDSEYKETCLSVFKKDFFNPFIFEKKTDFLAGLFLRHPPKKVFAHLSFDVEGTLNLDLLASYLEEIDHWRKEKISAHKINIENIEKYQSSFKQLNELELICPCDICVSKYRNLIRTSLVEGFKKKIVSAKEQFDESILSSSISQNARYLGRLRKDIENDLRKLRFKMKKSSINKMDQQLNSTLDQYFGKDSELFNVYKERIQAFFNGHMAEKNVDPTLVNHEEWVHFFEKLGTNIWRSENYLRREFDRYLRSLLTFKRKDVSSAILKEYIGKFWLHSPTRRKNRKVIYHMGPTNSGKTYQAIQRLVQAKNGCYLAPLRLLASELYDRMNELGAKTCLMTGEEVIEVEGATHYSSTIEMAKITHKFECCVIDEIQMMSNTQRGWAWTRALLNLDTEELHLCGDDSVFNLVESILKLTGDTLEVRRYERMTDLKVENQEIEATELVKGDTLIVFSRKSALRYKSDLEKLGHNVSIVYGMLGPDVRKEQARKFDKGETDILVSTDAIAMGMNLPVRRIVFSAIKKFINNKEHLLSDSEIKQISGRAGRFQRFPTGYVTCLKSKEYNLDRIQEALHAHLDQKSRAMVGPDLDIFSRVNNALKDNKLDPLALTEFLHLFNDIKFENPFYCVQLNEMIKVAEMVEEINFKVQSLDDSELFGFSCAPVNLGLSEHVQYFYQIVNKYAHNQSIEANDIDIQSRNIDYLETAIKCIELYQWLARHFNEKNFVFEKDHIVYNKSLAIERLNQLLSEKSEKYFYKEYRRFKRGGAGPRGDGKKRTDGTRSENKYKGKKKFRRSRNSKKFRSKKRDS